MTDDTSADDGQAFEAAPISLDRPDHIDSPSESFFICGVRSTVHEPVLQPSAITVMYSK
jgi:hypothetical protein